MSDKYEYSREKELRPGENRIDYKERNVQKPFWRYFLTVLITVLVTSALLIGAGMLVFREPILQMMRGDDNRTPSAITPDGEKDTGRIGISFADTPENRQSLKKLDDIYRLLKDNYYEELTEADLIEAMATGMIGEMSSQFTFYMSPEQYQSMTESMSGEFSGIGAIISKQADMQYEIAEVLDNSPAMKAGVHVYDIFVAVDGKPVEEYENMDALVADVRGEEGSDVTIEFYRPSENKNVEITITRGKITNANVRDKKLTDKIGYVRVTEFNSGVAANFKEAMKKRMDDGAKYMVLDLRGNTGGYVHEVIEMLDYLLPEGLLITEKGRSDGKDFKTELRSDKSMGVPESMRYVILMNRYSASASELFAGTLRDYDKAVLVGEKSYGKGVGTVSYILNDKSAVQITNFYYYLPKGDNVQDKGLEPDYEAAIDPEYNGISLNQLTLEQDAPLKKAIEILESY